MKFKAWINVILIVLLLIFVLQNLIIYEVKFLFVRFELPLFIIILVSFFIGYLTPVFMRAFTRKKGSDASEEKTTEG